MAVTFLNTTYYNADGLTQAYGTEEGRVGKGGEFQSMGELRVINVAIPDLTALSATQTSPSILDRNVFLPKAAYIRRVRLINTGTAVTTGSTSLINVGTVKRDTTTEGDFNGILDSIDSADFNAAGEERDYIFGTTGAGALVGVTSGTDSGGYYISASAETAVFTAGAVKIQIFFDFNQT